MLLAYFCFVHVSLVLPGYVLLKKTRYFSDRPGIELSLAYLLTIVIFATLATINYVTGLDPRIARAICGLLLVGAGFEFCRLRYFRDMLALRFPLVCVIAMSLFALVFIHLPYHKSYAYIPDPQPVAGAHYNDEATKVINVSQTQALDSYIPYRQAQFFVNRSDPGKDSFINEWGVHFFERTPLMGAVTATYFTMSNDHPPIGYTWSPDSHDIDHTYAKFQVIAAILNSIFIIPAFFLLTKLFHRKTALITCLFMVPSQFFLYNAVFTWPKSFVAFPILLSWLLLIERRRGYVVLAGMAAGVAYLIHDLAFLYVGATALLLLYERRFRDMFVYALTPITFALSWFVVSSSVYHRQSTFIYYPLSINNIPQANQERYIVHQFFHTSLFHLLYIRIFNIVYQLTPYQLLTSEGGQMATLRLWAFGIFSIPGAVGAGLFIPAVLAGLRRLKGIGSVWILALGPVLFEALFIGWPKGLGALHYAEATVVLLMGIGVYYLTTFKNWRWVSVVYLLNTAQLIYYITYSYGFVVRNWLEHPVQLVSLFFMTSIVAACGWLVYCAAHNKHTWFLAE